MRTREDLFNLNWILIESTSATDGPVIDNQIVRAFPNPVRKQFNIIFQEAPVGTPAIALHAINGSSLDAIRSIDWNDTQLTIDLEGLSAGIYYLSITFDGKLYSVPFVR